MSTDTRLNCIRSLQSNPDPETTTTVGTDASGVLYAKEQVLLEKLRRYADQRKLAAVAFDSITRDIKEVYPAKHDLLQVLAEASTEETQVVVQAMKSPTLFYLRKSHFRFAELYELLREAYREKKPVALAVFPGSKWVEDARLDLPCN